jgi:D-alanyl-lipoteichoic acid acyltransferase DltB (MBOAT superfamily)
MQEEIYMFDAWLAVFAFSGQIFFDFAGYSLCAIGIALCLGFSIPNNFKCPYAAMGFSDFWRRWHVSLSEWLRDYLYIPLGGNRQGKTRTKINLMLTMLLGGLGGESMELIFW